MENLDGEFVLLHPARDAVFYMNRTGALVWQLCDGSRTVDEILNLLSAAYPDSAEQIRADVPALVHSLIDQGILKSG